MPRHLAKTLVVSVGQTTIDFLYRVSLKIHNQGICLVLEKKHSAKVGVFADADFLSVVLGKAFTVYFYTFVEYILY
jgi:hypothetical protein